MASVSLMTVVLNDQSATNARPTTKTIGTSVMAIMPSVTTAVTPEKALEHRRRGAGCDRWGC